MFRETPWTLEFPKRKIETLFYFTVSTREVTGYIKCSFEQQCSFFRLSHGFLVLSGRILPVWNYSRDKRFSDQQSLQGVNRSGLGWHGWQKYGCSSADPCIRTRTAVKVPVWSQIRTKQFKSSPWDSTTMMMMMRRGFAPLPSSLMDFSQSGKNLTTFSSQGKQGVFSVNQ